MSFVTTNCRGAYRGVPMPARLAKRPGIIEGVYSADTEARLRHELEDKGLFVLSRPKGAIGGVSLHLPHKRRIPPREFLVFNQELATLLKAGMPLVQSLDLLKRRVDSPLFRTVLEDVHEKVRSGSALSDAFAAHGDCFRGCTPRRCSRASAAATSTPCCAVRRYAKVIATIKRKTISALVYPAILVTLALGLVSIIVLKVVPAFSDFYTSFGAELPLVTRIILAISNFLRSQFLLILVTLAARHRGFVWVKQPGQQARSITGSFVRRWSARSPPSSRHRRWRARWPRCSAAACRW